MQASVEGADILLHANRCNKDTTSEGTRGCSNRGAGCKWAIHQWTMRDIHQHVRNETCSTVSWSWTVSAPASPQATLTFTSLSVNVIKA